MKSNEAYHQLIERFADGREICNCGEAYHTNCGVGVDLNGPSTTLPACQYGCSANQIYAKHYIAERVLALLDAARK